MSKGKRTITERFTVAGGELVDFVKKLIADGNVRRLVIRRPSGEALIEIPLTAGVAVGGALTLLAPVIAAVGAIAALLAKFEVDVERVDEPPGYLEDGEDRRWDRLEDDEQR
ncbi:DUF4342 domain-containing protein [uncultured Thiohalocapsa sp.]|jgi:hypothetical protein|uniref:DUF4342 domain-containing protein n=1 Tax=uncultured Thiohalocapsa sp. TaxID=768990 RepID=UPI0025D201EB|nr:DUF4342 domain-containing protein [uncultured Thiohalocapsa sp.]